MALLTQPWRGGVGEAEGCGFLGPGGAVGGGCHHRVFHVRGDAETANLYRELLAAARPDLEEELSRWVGDLPARHLSRLALSVRT